MHICVCGNSFFLIVFFLPFMSKQKTITPGRNNYCIYTLGRPVHLPQVMKIYGSSSFFFPSNLPLHPPPPRWRHLSPTAHPSPNDSLHPTTFLSSPFGVAHLYGNNWSTSPPALFKVCFHHPPLSPFFWCFFFY